MLKVCYTMLNARAGIVSIVTTVSDFPAQEITGIIEGFQHVLFGQNFKDAVL